MYLFIVRIKSIVNLMGSCPQKMRLNLLMSMKWRDWKVFFG